MSREISSSHGRVARAVFELVENATLDLDDLIRAIVDIEGRAEYREKNDDILAGGVMARAAGGAGTFSEVGLVNPAGSGILGVVEMVRATGPAGAPLATGYELFVTTQVALEATAGWVYGGITTYRDMRRAFNKDGSLAQTALKLGASIPAVQTGAGFWLPASAESPFARAPSALAVIPPGLALNIADLTANEQVNVSVIWYERIVRRLV